jgi:hypothetical protein
VKILQIYRCFLNNIKLMGTAILINQIGIVYIDVY